jgi:prolipoprotein diacylglyceryl transferase
VQIGALNLRWYGTLLALGVLLGGRLTRRELVRRGLDGEKVYTVATWAVPFGVIGARLYHVATDWSRFDGHLAEIPQLWHGGLGLPGVVAGGALGAVIGSRRAGIPARVTMDCIAPGLIAAQALGRWGNWANQELFGGPSSLPWAVEIAPANRPAQYATSATFQPTFLYESLWNLLVLLVLYRLIRALWTRLPAGTIFVAYLALYSFGRFFIEGMRVDPANHIAGVRINQWLFAAVFVVASALLARGLRRATPPSPAGPPEPSA